MAEYDDSNRGSIWPNKKKETDKHPDFTGSQNVVCAKCGQPSDYWASSWKRKPDAKPNAPSLTTVLKPKDGKPMDEPRKPDLARDMDDEIPF
jgi:hypothetical protein